MRHLFRCQILRKSDSRCDTRKSDSATCADLPLAAECALGPGCLEARPIGACALIGAHRPRAACIPPNANRHGRPAEGRWRRPHRHRQVGEGRRATRGRRLAKYLVVSRAALYRYFNADGAAWIPREPVRCSAVLHKAGHDGRGRRAGLGALTDGHDSSVSMCQGQFSRGDWPRLAPRPAPVRGIGMAKFSVDRISCAIPVHKRPRGSASVRLVTT